MSTSLRSGCPFSGSYRNGDQRHDDNLAYPLKEHNSAAPRVPTGKARVKLLYEEYIHLSWLKQVWDSPLTESPVLEPSFAAGMHGIELCFLLLAEFIADPRNYVAKRPRIEKVSDDIASQCKLLVEVIDGELEEEGTQTNRLTLTQEFPFPGAPPSRSHPSHSPGLARLESAIRAALPAMSMAERNSLIKVVINLTSTAFGSFERWSVGLGLEPQLNTLREAVGLPTIEFQHTYWLDYSAIVRPEVCTKTLTFKDTWTYHEDFFFRTVHLGTECWAKIALTRLDSARELASAGQWHVAAARILQASRILDYLGSHVMLLTSMNLRDYLLLKVELEGTSGEGSIQVKSFRPTVASLFTPLATALLPAFENGDTVSTTMDNDLALGQALMRVYEFPDRLDIATTHPAGANHSRSHRELYNYAKALEDVESGLLGGFYFKHFRLASNVIGSDARGTMRRAVQGLKSTYETPVFPILDRVRSGLGAKVDAELAHVKGRMMQEIIDTHLKKEEGVVGDDTSLGSIAITARAGGGAPPLTRGEGANNVAAALDICPNVQTRKENATTLASCPVSTHTPSVADSSSNGATSTLTYNPSNLAEVEVFEKLYSMATVPIALRAEISESITKYSTTCLTLPSALTKNTDGSPLSFLDHAWGRIPPAALHAALIDIAALYSCGNPSWDVLYGSIMPTAADHIRRVLGLSSTNNAFEGETELAEKIDSVVDVHFGHNSHELVTRILSELLLEESSESHQGQIPGDEKKVRILTTDSEFYSFTRQLNRLTLAEVVVVEAVAAGPVETFSARCIDAAAHAVAEGRPFHFVYLSQVTALTQQVLLPNLVDFVPRMNKILQNQDEIKQPLLIIDGYHSFCAMPTPLAGGEGGVNLVGHQCCFVAGLIKHAGSGANCAFITVPRHYNLRPAFTGWLSDPSVLSGPSAGIQIGSPVDYLPELALQGGTPAYFLPLLIFNHVQRLWLEADISVEKIHKYVFGLQDAFLTQLASAENIQNITIERLVNEESDGEMTNWRSHTLVFKQENAQQAAAVVERVKQNNNGGVLIDNRKGYLRIGFGPYHTVKDVGVLIQALAT
jgi:tryptophan 2,3-dioxygenase